MITLEHLLLLLLNARESVMCASEAQTDFYFPHKIEKIFLSSLSKNKKETILSVGSQVSARPLRIYLSNITPLISAYCTTPSDCAWVCGFSLTLLPFALLLCGIRN